MTAIVGESGCGKSTLAALISGARKGYTGSLTISGQEAYQLNSQSLADHFTVVSSGSFIFSGTVRDNLRMGREDATEEEMLAALRTARIADWLKTRGGLDAEISADASNLSGGQRQRLALARALLHDTPAYIFDEATSNIDVESEQDILDAIHAFRGKKTVLLITHRLENAVNADQIYVMDHGRIAGQGTHQTLLASNPAYQALHQAQAACEQYARKGGDPA